MSRGKVLLIDDNDSIRETMQVFLDDLGFSVIETNNGTLALPMIRQHRPDLVICDLVMPQLSGLIVLKQIKLEYPNQTVIMMSGLQEGAPSEEAKRLGAAEYITKPVSLDQLELILLKFFPKG